MKMRQTRDYSHQIWSVQGLMHVDTERYELVEFKCEEWAAGNVNVSRVYRPKHCKHVAYHQSFKIGPRGGRTKIYDSFY